MPLQKHLLIAYNPAYPAACDPANPVKKRKKTFISQNYEIVSVSPVRPDRPVLSIASLTTPLERAEARPPLIHNFAQQHNVAIIQLMNHLAVV